MVERFEGKVVIDGIDINQLDLSTLRYVLSSNSCYREFVKQLLKHCSSLFKLYTVYVLML